MISPAQLVAKTPREATGTQDITGGLPRVTEIFEARKPKDPAVIAEIDGASRDPAAKRNAANVPLSSAARAASNANTWFRTTSILRVHSGDYVKAGDSLVDGPLVPHDILRISGEEAVQQYLTREIQNVYRSQRVEINDKHIEIIVGQMLRKVRVESPGDTNLLPGSVMDKFEFRKANHGLSNCLVITDQGRAVSLRKTRSCPRTCSSRPTPRSKLDGDDRQGDPTEDGQRGRPSCWASPRRPCKARASSPPPASRRPPRCSPRRPWPAKVDELVGLKENVILGHLIPAGTGFHSIQESEVRIRPAKHSKRWPPPKEKVLERSPSRCWSRRSPVATGPMATRPRRPHLPPPANQSQQWTGCPVPGWRRAATDLAAATAAERIAAHAPRRRAVAVDNRRRLGSLKEFALPVGTSQFQRPAGQHPAHHQSAHFHRHTTGEIQNFDAEQLTPNSTHRTGNLEDGSAAHVFQHVIFQTRSETQNPRSFMPTVNQLVRHRRKKKRKFSKAPVLDRCPAATWESVCRSAP